MSGAFTERDTVRFGRARLTARLSMDAEGRIVRHFPVASGDLLVTAGWDVVLRGTDHGGSPRDVVRIDGGSVRAVSFGRALRRSSQVRPWSEDEPRPTRVAHVLGRRADVVLVVADRPGHAGASILWGFDLWRAPDGAAREGAARLAAAAGARPPAASVLSEEVHGALVRIARSGGDPHAITDGSY